MGVIEIPFTASNLGRVEITAGVMTGNRKSFADVEFKLDSGSDFTTLSCNDLNNLGYSLNFLQNCQYYSTDASTASGALRLQFITNVSIKLSERELQGCRVFFALGTNLRSLLGSDILKYFNWEVNYDLGLLRMNQVAAKPALSPGESPLQVYAFEESLPSMPFTSN